MIKKKVVKDYYPAHLDSLYEYIRKVDNYSIYALIDREVKDTLWWSLRIKSLPVVEWLCLND